MDIIMIISSTWWSSLVCLFRTHASNWTQLRKGWKKIAFPWSSQNPTCIASLKPNSEQLLRKVVTNVETFVPYCYYTVTTRTNCWTFLRLDVNTLSKSRQEILLILSDQLSATKGEAFVSSLFCRQLSWSCWGIKKEDPNFSDTVIKMRLTYYESVLIKLLFRICLKWKFFWASLCIANTY